ncbi:hypothetical protein NQZ68_036988 [Dissostichus eleginoides]|nr:hypothetical protein NQZ68_036988 [Dissostichus eleginoides]
MRRKTEGARHQLAGHLGVSKPVAACVVALSSAESDTLVTSEAPVIAEGDKDIVVQSKAVLQEGRQRFRGLKKTPGQTYVDFAREKKILFDSVIPLSESVISLSETLIIELLTHTSPVPVFQCQVPS